MKKILKTLMSSVVLSSMLFAGSACAERVGQVTTSGIFFKDKINIEVFDDPTISGISCYINLPDRSGSWDDQTDTALACRQVGPVSGDLVSRENLFSASKGIFFKHMRVDRFWDPKRNVMVYISYTKKSSGDNASSGLSVVPIAQ